MDPDKDYRMLTKDGKREVRMKGREWRAKAGIEDPK